MSGAFLFLFVCASGKGKGKASSKLTTAKILRESRVIPTLVFYLEQFDVALVKLAKVIKVPVWVCVCGCMWHLPGRCVGVCVLCCVSLP